MQLSMLIPQRGGGSGGGGLEGVGWKGGGGSGICGVFGHQLHPHPGDFE